MAAEQAWYLASPKIATPMDAGLASFCEEAGARTEQGKLGGQVLNWAEVLARPVGTAAGG